MAVSVHLYWLQRATSRLSLRGVLPLLACRRAGLDGVTLVRDESGAALSPENARAYVAMLRRAAQIVRADRVLVVSHSPEVVELADDRIVLSMPASEPAIAAE